MPNQIDILRESIKAKVDVVNNQEKLRIILLLLKNEEKLRRVTKFLDDDTYRSESLEEFQRIKHKINAFKDQNSPSGEMELDGLLQAFVQEMEATYSDI